MKDNRSPDQRGDEVDQIVAAWRRERPDLDVEPMQVWSRISRLAQILEQLRSQAFAAQEIQAWEYDVLAALRRAGAPYRLSAGQLVEQTHVTSGTITNRVDRLVGRDLVRRLADPADGRAVLVELTVAGRALVDAATASLTKAEAEFLTIDEAGRSQLADLLRQLLASAK